jgi:serine/threonine protein phosphatase PrpC
MPQWFRAPLIGAKSDSGYAQKKNEDAYRVFKIGHGTWEAHPERSMYVSMVADGVASRAGGARASQVAVQTIESFLLRKREITNCRRTLSAAIDEAIQEANWRIVEVAQGRSGWGSMSTTLVLAAISNGLLYLAHLGDSRAYLIRHRRIHRLTLDHSWVQDALDRNRINAEDARRHPNRNVIRCYLGISPVIDVDRRIVLPGTYNHGLTNRQFASELALRRGDVILLCSDGLTDNVSDEEILAMVRRRRHRPQQVADELIQSVLIRRGTDNVTITLLSLVSGSRRFSLVKKLV